jgi:UDPglucose 6-dehydrogenase
MKISVIGAGYVGLTTAACLAHLGHDVFCSESEPRKLQKLKDGGIPFFEPYLSDLMGRARTRLQFGSTTDAIAHAGVIFICVGTPPLPNGDADLSAIESVARMVAKQATGYRLLVEKSTVPVQTGSQLRDYLALYGNEKLTCEVASNPEFLREGSAIEDFLHPERVVVGVESERATKLLEAVYEPLMNGEFECPVHPECKYIKQPVFFVTDISSAELIKHASNSFLAMKISFINMVADLCEKVGADATRVAEGMGLDSRIGAAFLNPGIGFGGFCFPKDIQAFIRIAHKAGCDFSLLKEVERINQNRIEYFMEKLRKEMWVLRGKKIAVWGLAFKPNTDDIRFAPSIPLLSALMEDGVAVRAYDSQATEKMRELFPRITYCSNPYEAAEGADAILIVTEWKEFSSVDWQRIRRLVEDPLVIDGRNALSADELTRHGFRYVGTGRMCSKAGSATLAHHVPPATSSAVPSGLIETMPARYPGV